MDSTTMESMARDGAATVDVRVAPPIDVRLRDFEIRHRRLRGTHMSKGEAMDLLRQIGMSYDGYEIETPGTLRRFAHEVCAWVVYAWSTLGTVTEGLGDLHICLKALHQDRAMLVASVEELRQQVERLKAQPASEPGGRRRGHNLGSSSSDNGVGMPATSSRVEQGLEDRVRALEERQHCTTLMLEMEGLHHRVRQLEELEDRAPLIDKLEESVRLLDERDDRVQLLDKRLASLEGRQHPQNSASTLGKRDRSLELDPYADARPAASPHPLQAAIDRKRNEYH